MRVFFIPWGGMETASSRLRVHNVVPHIKGAKVGTPKNYKKGDILVIQKAVRPDELLKAQAQGAKVIYDIDDNYLDKPEFAEMCRRADMVTVGSYYFHKWFPDAPVIDDSLDWDGTTQVLETGKPSKLVGWHGYGNLNYLQAFAHVFLQKGYNIRAIVGERYMNYYQQYDVKRWDLKTIDFLLAECDLCAFYLPDDDFSQAKGMNKLIKCWAIGIPAFVSYMPEYDRVMRESGQRGFMVANDNWEHHDFTKPWVPEMREYALRFTPDKIAKQWESAFKLL